MRRGFGPAAKFCPSSSSAGRLTAAKQMTNSMVMKQVTLARAKATLSALLDRVEAGETVQITRRHRVVAEVRPAGRRPRASPRPIGLCRNEFKVPRDFDAPLPDDVLDAFEGR
jgi:antitoxin (DNA-binding transcriptional repressor) of toxin-antitoxin stability system